MPIIFYIFIDLQISQHPLSSHKQPPRHRYKPRGGNERQLHWDGRQKAGQERRKSHAQRLNRLPDSKNFALFVLRTPWRKHGGEVGHACALRIGNERHDAKEHPVLARQQQCEHRKRQNGHRAHDDGRAWKPGSEQSVGKTLGHRDPQARIAEENADLQLRDGEFLQKEDLKELGEEVESHHLKEPYEQERAKITALESRKRAREALERMQIHRLFGFERLGQPQCHKDHVEQRDECGEPERSGEGERRMYGCIGENASENGPEDEAEAEGHSDHAKAARALFARGDIAHGRLHHRNVAAGEAVEQSSQDDQDEASGRNAHRDHHVRCERADSA